MANKKISELSVVTALAGTDVLPVVVGGGTTNKVTYQNFLRNAPDGTATAPSIANVGDQDSGILFPATNSVAISTGGTQRFVVNGNGNVGIGESSPLTPLHVSSTGDTVVRITSADGNGAFLDLGDASDPDGGRVVYDSGSNLTFSTASTERLRINSSGNVGIGATAPAAKLDVAGNQIFTAANPQIQFNAGGPIVRLPSANTLAFLSDSTNERMRIDSAGKVGIGTSTPGAELDVDKGSANCTIRARTGSGFSSFLSLLPNGDGTGVALAANSDQSAQLFNQLNSHFAFGTNNTERLRIDSSGRLGLGTTSPSAPFAFGKSDYGEPTSEDFFRIKFKDFGGTNNDVGIGQPNEYSLAFNIEGGSTASYRWYAGTAGERMRLDGSGNVLLGGTASPASATKSLAIFNGTAPTGSVTDGVVLYAEDVSSSSELKVRDEAGNVTTLSPHNFDLIPEGPSEDMAWSYYSEKDGKRINVDMLKAVRLLEQLTGEQLVFTG